MRTRPSSRKMTVNPFRLFCWPVKIRVRAPSSHAPRNPHYFQASSSLILPDLTSRDGMPRFRAGRLAEPAEVDWRVFGEQDEPTQE